MNVGPFLDSLRSDPSYDGQIVHVHTEPSRSPTWGSIPERLLPPVRSFLDALGVTRLYSHQTRAIEAALDGTDVLLTTGTASGKSLCYQVPILQAILQDCNQE